LTFHLNDILAKLLHFELRKVVRNMPISSEAKFKAIQKAKVNTAGKNLPPLTKGEDQIVHNTYMIAEIAQCTWYEYSTQIFYYIMRILYNNY